MAIKIDKNVPLTKEAKRMNNRYPFKDMQIGDSFLAECDITDPKELKRLKTSMHRSASYHRDYIKEERSYRTAIEPEGLRMWRIA